MCFTFFILRIFTGRFVGVGLCGLLVCLFLLGLPVKILHSISVSLLLRISSS